MSSINSMNYKLYVVNTSKNLNELVDFLCQMTKNTKHIGPIRKDFTRNSITLKYSESSRKYIILSKVFYNNLKKHGYGEDGDNSEEMEIIEYELSNESFAHKNSSMMHFYFPVDNKENIKTITKRLQYFTNMKMLDLDDWYIHDEGIVEFSNAISNTTRAIIKIMLDNPEEFRVSWVRHKLWNKITKQYQENCKNRNE